MERERVRAYASPPSAAPRDLLLFRHLRRTIPPFCQKLSFFVLRFYLKNSTFIGIDVLSVSTAILTAQTPLDRYLLRDDDATIPLDLINVEVFSRACLLPFSRRGQSVSTVFGRYKSYVFILQCVTSSNDLFRTYHGRTRARERNECSLASFVCASRSLFLSSHSSLAFRPSRHSSPRRSTRSHNHGCQPCHT